MTGDIDRHLGDLDVAASCGIGRILFEELVLFFVSVFFISWFISHRLARLRSISVGLITNGYTLHNTDIINSRTINSLADDLVRRRRFLALYLIVCWVNSEPLTVLTLRERILAVSCNASRPTRSRPSFTVLMLWLLIPLTICLRLGFIDLRVLEVDGFGHGADPSTNKLIDISRLVLQGWVRLIKATVVFYGSSEHRVLLQLTL